MVICVGFSCGVGLKRLCDAIGFGFDAFGWFVDVCLVRWFDS